MRFCTYKEGWQQSTCGCRGTAAQVLLTTFDVCLQLQGKVTSALATTGDQLGAYAYMGEACKPCVPHLEISWADLMVN